MKAQALMLGDWVQGYLPDTSLKVVGIPSEYRLAVVTSDRTYMELSIDDCQPIPITPEILEKSGFEFLYSSVPGGGSLQEQRRKKVDTYKWHGLVINFFHENSDFQIMDIRRARFNYVHELQHALRLCGIDKEINL